MASSNGDTNSVDDTPMQLDLPHWAYDMYPDDDEFRAGYPFSDIPEMDSDGEA